MSATKRIFIPCIDIIMYCKPKNDDDNISAVTRPNGMRAVLRVRQAISGSHRVTETQEIDAVSSVKTRLLLKCNERRRRMKAGSDNGPRCAIHDQLEQHRQSAARQLPIWGLEDDRQLMPLRDAYRNNGRRQQSTNRPRASRIPVPIRAQPDHLRPPAQPPRRQDPPVQLYCGSRLPVAERQGPAPERLPRPARTQAPQAYDAVNFNVSQRSRRNAADDVPAAADDEASQRSRRNTSDVSRRSKRSGTYDAAAQAPYAGHGNFDMQPNGGGNAGTFTVSGTFQMNNTGHHRMQQPIAEYSSDSSVYPVVQFSPRSSFGEDQGVSEGLLGRMSYSSDSGGDDDDDNGDDDANGERRPQTLRRRSQSESSIAAENDKRPQTRHRRSQSESSMANENDRRRPQTRRRRSQSEWCTSSITDDHRDDEAPTPRAFRLGDPFTTTPRNLGRDSRPTSLDRVSSSTFVGNRRCSPNRRNSR